MAQTAPIVAPEMMTGLFRNRTGAEHACDAVVSRGYDAADISVVMSDATRKRDFALGSDRTVAEGSKAGEPARESLDKAVEGTKLGGPVGGTLGTIAPAVAAAGTLLLIPGLVFAGPVMVALAAAGAVGVAGGLVGVFTSWGIPKSRLEEYEAGILAGGILLAIKPKSAEDARYFKQQWQINGGELVHS